MELKIGFMATKELAEWGGVSEKYLLSQKKRWCVNTLSKYAKYEIVKGGVTILEIMQPVFQSKVKKQVEKHFDECWGNKDFKADTCRNVANKLKKLITADAVSDQTLYTYTCLTKREFYGVPKCYNGKYGDCHYIFCKKINGEALPFTEQEEKIRKTLFKIYLEGAEQQVLDLQAVKESYKNKEITEEEYLNAIEGIMENDCGWTLFVTRLEETLGCEVGFATLIRQNGIYTILKEDGAGA